MNEDWSERFLDHLERILEEIEKMKRELIEKPDDFGDFENRIYWAIRGVNPHKAVCKKHNRNITRNDYGEYVCGDCIEEFIHNEISEFDENLYSDPNDEPTTKIQGIHYGD